MHHPRHLGAIPLHLLNGAAVARAVHAATLKTNHRGVQEVAWGGRSDAVQAVRAQLCCATIGPLGACVASDSLVTAAVSTTTRSAAEVIRQMHPEPRLDEESRVEPAVELTAHRWLASA